MTSFALSTACVEVEPSDFSSSVGQGDNNGDDETGGAECTFDTVMPDMTCGSNEGMICPGTTYCDSCGEEVMVSCTCVDSGSSFGPQFQCEPCEDACEGSETSGDGDPGDGDGDGDGDGKNAAATEACTALCGLFGTCVGTDPSCLEDCIGPLLDITDDSCFDKELALMQCLERRPV